MFTSYDKAIASFLGTLLPLLAAFGFHLPFSTETIIAITPFISMILTWLVPNLPSAPTLPVPSTSGTASGPSQRFDPFKDQSPPG